MHRFRKLSFRMSFFHMYKFQSVIVDTLYNDINNFVIELTKAFKWITGEKLDLRKWGPGKTKWKNIKKGTLETERSKKQTDFCHRELI